MEEKDKNKLPKNEPKIRIITMEDFEKTIPNDAKTFEELGFKRIVRRDDSDDEPDFLEVLEADFSKLSARKLKDGNVTFKKAFGISKPLFDSPLKYIHSALKIEERKEAVDQDLARYIQLKRNYFEVLGEEVSEDDIQRIVHYWLDEKIKAIDSKILNTDDPEELFQLEKLREHLEGLKNPGKPDGEKHIETTQPKYFISPETLDIARNALTELQLINDLGKYIGRSNTPVKALYNVLKQRSYIQGTESHLSEAFVTFLLEHFNISISGRALQDSNQGQKDFEDELKTKIPAQK